MHFLECAVECSATAEGTIQVGYTVLGSNTYDLPPNYPFDEMVCIWLCFEASPISELTSQTSVVAYNVSSRIVEGNSFVFRYPLPMVSRQPLLCDVRLMRSGRLRKAV